MSTGVDEELEIWRDDVSSVEEVIHKLELLRDAKRYEKSKKFTTVIPNSEFKTIDSWKFSDFSYAKVDTLPINARGLFTINSNSIAIRGYDKFFNIDETDSTKKQNLKTKTVGPYKVTLKENGCIIFIAGTEEGQLLVSSKHSIGHRDDVDKNHAQYGESTVLNQLNEIGKSATDLANYLYKYNLTAVAELCDDEFEEHVLAYTKDKAGLYLHGINYNTIQFRTVPIEKVVSFAHDWGFKTVDYLSFDNIDDFFTFYDKCSETGTYGGKEIEGFVIRCKDIEHKDFFFKAKFEQPYLLYRQFREVTRKVFIENKPLNQIHIPKNKLITVQYINFVKDLFSENPELKEKFAANHGVVELRQSFIASLNESFGINLLNIDSLNEKFSNELAAASLETIKYVIVPIATIGCGKTTVFETLTHLFPDWVHIQNDNIGKSAKIKIVEKTVIELNQTNYPVVLLDRNNCEYRERRQILQDFETYSKKYQVEPFTVKFIGLNFVGDKDKLFVKKITLDRIKKRGDNHQSIKSATDEETSRRVLDNFIYRFQAVDTTKYPDNQFDLMIDLDLEAESSLINVHTVLQTLHTEFPALVKNIPDEEAVKVAFEKALNTKPTFTKIMNNKKQVQYYAFNVEKDLLLEQLNVYLQDNEQWKKLIELNRVQDEFHVTLGHVSSHRVQESKAKWKTLVRRFQTVFEYDDQNVLNYYGDIRLLKVVINKEKLICILVELLDVYSVNKVDPIPKVEPTNKYLHITLGTFDKSIAAFQSNVTLSNLSESREILGLEDDEYTVANGDVIQVINFKNDIVFKGQWLYAHF
ncbi:RNA ligase-domain-containing protein [Scheffersomyces coipomensis]|uniref:RNA ligase-domain-containing protein n=1 Tax=Scheffersomyces coipomensis TaxID=1788519 RepID=UPI00315DC51D